MNFKIFSITVLCCVSFLGNANNFYPEKLAQKMVRIVLKDKNITLKEKIEVPQDNVNGKRSYVIYSFLKNENKEKFFAIFTQAVGRYDPFDYVVITSNKFAVVKVRVLKYRSEHGGEIASKKWLKQFENYTSGALRYKKEISALSGATISAGSIVDDIPKVLEILKRSCE